VRRRLSAALVAAAALGGCASHAASRPAHRASRTGGVVALPTSPLKPHAAQPRRRRKEHWYAALRPEPTAKLVTHGPRSGHDVALTFDADMTQAMLAKVRGGAPSEGYDPRIVSELRASHTPATIFMTGLWPSAHPGPAHQLASDPLFEIENHTYDHASFTPRCYGLPAVAGASAKRAEVERTERILTTLSGRQPAYLRFPGGCHSSADVSLVASLGEQPLQWDVISGDAYLRDPAAVARQTLAGVRPGSIVVMHLVGAPTAPATAEALRTVLPALRRRGLRPVKLERLLR
jgi:peptidoglycan/xylan/chitin deacetylase (PgdA/CDA1 family)